MRKVIILLLLTILSFTFGWMAKSKFGNTELYNIPKTVVNREKPLEKYSFENLASKEIPQGKLTIGDTLKDENAFITKVFTLEFDPALQSKDIKKVTGVINLPKKKAIVGSPLVVMFRGYVDQKTYTPGTGTKNAANYFANNGFITIAPDFLGYGGSDQESGNIFESRFQTYTTALTLLNSISSIPNWDQKNIFIWGHSNGGQIALTILELSGKKIPTVVWAPVSKPFPYSVLYYTDESNDRGKLIRSELAKFENDYDVEKFSLTNYLDKIKAPLQIHQGTLDNAVPIAWTNALVKALKEKGESVDYFTYPGTDHNLQPNWGAATQRSLEFFQKNLTNF